MTAGALALAAIAPALDPAEQAAEAGPAAPPIRNEAATRAVPASAQAGPGTPGDTRGETRLAAAGETGAAASRNTRRSGLPGYHPLTAGFRPAAAFAGAEHAAMAARASRATHRRPAGVGPAASSTPERPGALTAARAFRVAEQVAARERRLQQMVGVQAVGLVGVQVAGVRAARHQLIQRRAAHRQPARHRAALGRTVPPPAAPPPVAPQRIGSETAARLAAQIRQAAQRRIAQAEARRIAQAAAAASRTLRMRAIRQHSRPLVPHRRTVVTKHAAVRNAQRVVRLRNGMTAVIAYARSQVGKRYVSGGEGPYGFDCSGFTKRAYAEAGIRLPHSSGAQAALARIVSSAQARPGDLVVGRGHVGIYMGRGMMIDAGNQRTGVVYRRLYSGLRVARL